MVAGRKPDAQEVRDAVASQPLGFHRPHGELGQHVVAERRDVECLGSANRMGKRAPHAGHIPLSRLVVGPHHPVGCRREHSLPGVPEVSADGP